MLLFFYRECEQIILETKIVQLRDPVEFEVQMIPGQVLEYAMRSLFIYICTNGRILQIFTSLNSNLTFSAPVGCKSFKYQTLLKHGGCSFICVVTD